MNKTDFDKQIQQWVQIDDQVKSLNEKLKELRDKKHALNTNITKYAEQNNLFNSTFKINDDKLKFSNTKSQSPITLTYLQKCLGEIIKNEAQSKQIFEYINNRESKVVSEIRRL
jgi:hypothetical protein